jgi:hypothetical protein
VAGTVDLPGGSNNFVNPALLQNNRFSAVTPADAVRDLSLTSPVRSVRMILELFWMPPNLLCSNRHRR